MSLFKPLFVVLDSSTLGKIAFDYWSSESSRRQKARETIGELTDRGIYIAFTFSHVAELLRHENDELVQRRLAFLRSLPLIAWLRPYNRDWFPGGPVDLLCRELHAFMHGSGRSWIEIIEAVRSDLWETGTGQEMFIEDDALWGRLRIEFRKQLGRESYVASIARTTPGYVNELTLREVDQLPLRDIAERANFSCWFSRDLQMQLEKHGDKKLTEHEAIAKSFTDATLARVNGFEATGSDPIQQMIKSYGVPLHLLRPDMTIGEFGDLAVYVEQLKLISEHLRPRVVVTVNEVPIETLPSYVLQHRLARIQKKAVRISGSDLSDGHIAMLALYADAIETDKRTFEFLKQASRADESLGKLIHKNCRVSDYSDLAAIFDSR